MKQQWTEETSEFVSRNGAFCRKNRISTRNKHAISLWFVFQQRKTLTVCQEKNQPHIWDLPALNICPIADNSLTFQSSPVVNFGPTAVYQKAAAQQVLKTTGKKLGDFKDSERNCGIWKTLRTFFSIFLNSLLP